LVMSNGNETSIFSFIIVYYIVFLVLAVSINALKVRNAIQGIGLNLFVFMTPFMSLVFLTLNEVRRYSYYDLQGYHSRDPALTALYYLIAEIAGSVIFLILLEPLFRRLYRKWFAAPEN